ncbi:hypothetical protein BAZ12_00760 [Elizabethkingia miricola]|uniref:hypothetical protein n=1 Tax=Elizabethkingia TaxID=308865 RepID=UPI0008400BE1|nr:MULTISPECIES: hypothetical protein [Elizabethkingia]MCL1652598.1 hypothetical protein [Elizabethkingia miricola]OCW73162.1 hypothetical protein A4G24_15920 [Elizabethkingia anophelis]OPC71145.1 hypothetical protein BAZ13_09860 [Elizabethkingia miricola]OPC75606.1 hypothetical protein BAZ12_00760 [Elizabethkingia miricola]
MKKLEIQSKQITETLKEDINGQKIYYQYTYDGNTPAKVISFSTQSQNSKILNGSYQIDTAQLTLNGNISTIEDVELFKSIFTSVLEIVENTKKPAEPTTV